MIDNCGEINLFVLTYSVGIPLGTGLVILLLLFCCCSHLFVGPCFYNVGLSILSSFVIILLRKRELVALLYCVNAVVWSPVCCISSSLSSGLVCGL